jgi:hypothetical protein
MPTQRHEVTQPHIESSPATIGRRARALAGDPGPRALKPRRHRLRAARLTPSDSRR